MEEGTGAGREELDRAEQEILPVFRRDYEDLLRGRPEPRPLPSDDQAIFGLADKAVHEYLRAMIENPSLPRLSRHQLLELRRRLYVMHCALGPLGDLLKLEGVEDIHIHGTRGGYLEYGDRREPLPPTYRSDEELEQLVRWYAEQSGKHYDPGNALITVILPDGSRLNAIMAPVAKPSVTTIRLQQVRRFATLDDLVRERAVPKSGVAFLDNAVKAGLNIVIGGPTGSGKTTLARVLAMRIPEGERTCVIESDTELWLHDLRDDFFSLEEREANVEGAGRITMQDLFQRGALRQRPERIIVGEVRGTEALDMLHAMNSGHDGSITTVHGSQPRGSLNRIQMLAQAADPNLSPQVVNQMLGTGVDMIIQLGSFKRGGQRRRRLNRVCFVDQNIEDPSFGPVVQEVCRYRLATDDWEWDPDAISFMPLKVREKFEAAEIDDRHLRFGVMTDDAPR